MTVESTSLGSDSHSREFWHFTCPKLKYEFDPSATCRIFHFSSPALITEVLAFADSAVYVYGKIVRPRVAAL
jgi:hypothetical protein